LRENLMAMAADSKGPLARPVEIEEDGHRLKVLISPLLYGRMK
jgi:hypothetical protein